MLLRSIFFVILFTFTTFVFADNSAADKPIKWTAVFSHIQPTSDSNAMKQFCINHSPTTLITTYKEINSPQGVMTLNGLNIHYLHYQTKKVHDIYFYEVVGVISGGKGKDAWHSPIHLYEQTLTPFSTIWSTWSTPNCKGIFVATPTFIKPS